MDNSILIEPIQNSIELSPIQNSVEVYIVLVDSVFEFVSPVQVAVEKKEVGR